jgi:hypothetical protein
MDNVTHPFEEAADKLSALLAPARAGVGLALPLFGQFAADRWAR